MQGDIFIADARHVPEKIIPCEPIAGAFVTPRACLTLTDCKGAKIKRVLVLRYKEKILARRVQ